MPRKGRFDERYPGSGGARRNPGWAFTDDPSYAEHLEQTGYKARNLEDALVESEERAARKRVADQELVDSRIVRNETAALMQRLYNSSFRVAPAEVPAVRAKLEQAIEYFSEAIRRRGYDGPRDHESRIEQCKRALRELSS